MAGQSRWGNAGDSTNAFIVNPMLQKEIFFKTTWMTLVGRLNGGRELREQVMAFEGGRKRIDIGNSSLTQEKTITIGNEFRTTMMEYLSGNANYGDEQVASGDYAQYKHSRGYVNECKSPAWQLPGRCSLKQAAEVITNPKGDLLMGIERWVSEEMDIDWVRSGLMGGSRGILSATADGALGITLPGASAGQFRSCYNFYTPTSGVVVASRTRATHESNVNTALGTLGNNANSHFDLGEHDVLVNLCDQYYQEPATIGGRQYKAVFLCDRAIIWRLFARSGTLETLAKEARERGASNPALDHISAWELDDILYIPYRLIEKYRPATGSGVCSYGPGLDADPRNYTNSSKLALGMLMGAKSFLRGRDKRIWITTEVGRHGVGVEYGAHWDDGFVRNEWDAKDGRTEMENPHMFVCTYYDAGIGTAIGS
jgi:hypothetical protein